MITVDTRLDFRGALCPDNLFGHLAATAVPGVEEVCGTTYRRTLRMPSGPAIVALTPYLDHIACRATLSDVQDLAPLVARCRWLLDLDAEQATIDEQLGRDPALLAAVTASPGRRIPRTVDTLEMAVRAVLGQQISTAAARTHTARLVQRHGEPTIDTEGALTHLFPTIEALADARPDMPTARQRCFATLVRALADKQVVLDPCGDHSDTRRALAELPGIGPWTVAVIAMRALGDDDVLPVTDLGVRKGAAAVGIAATPAALTRHSEDWRPWRSYATQYLWAATDHPINTWPPPVAADRAARSKASNATFVIAPPR